MQPAEVVMAFDPDHPALADGPPRAAAVALALADAWRPDAGLTGTDGLEMDVERLRGLATVGSTGERTMAAVVLSLWGEGTVELSRLDALDRPSRELVADAMVVLAGYRPG